MSPSMYIQPVIDWDIIILCMAVILFVLELGELQNLKKLT